MFKIVIKFVLFGLIILFMTCQGLSEKEYLFSQITAEYSGINFENKIVENEVFNYYKYIYAYNGAGVAAADFNNDGLEDLFFISNLKAHKLYLNKGDFQFEDITIKSGIKKSPGFDTGVSVIDINNDGYLDIYICRAGWYKENSQYANLLYINNANLTFTEKAQEYGLADTSRSITSTFFDYDKDGDLDVYIVNTPIVTRDYRKVHNLDSIQKDPQTILLKGSDKLYQNNGTGHFTDVSLEAGILPERGFGLNAQISDMNQDDLPDIYVSNDFETPDFVYLNNGDGTFSESRDTLLKHMSYYSMGSDVGDINNDGLNDLIVLDMSPEDYVRSKTTMAMTSISKFREMIDKNYHHQYMHNVLQLNNGNGTFGEVSQMAGVAKTDWSWTPLLADFDLDGYNDIYITNGVYRDVIDQDVNKSILKTIRSKGKKPTKSEYLTYAKMLPQQKMTNYFFKNNGNLTFTNTSEKWIKASPTFSNGAVYTDLDNDGDLDIVVSNINEPATLLKNNAREQNTGNYLQIKFVGPENNKFGVGTIANLYLEDGTVQTRQLINSRGYLSSTSNTLHFGLKKEGANVENINILWPDGKFQNIENIPLNQLITIKYAEAVQKHLGSRNQERPKWFQKEVFNYEHKDTIYDDYQVQLLLPHKLSQLGPAMAKSDINKDGLDDIYLGGGYLQEGRLLLGLQSGGFKKMNIDDFVADKLYEDIGAIFFDANNDNNLDLYVVSGSYEFYEDSPLQQDRLYLNNGAGKFTNCYDCLPEMRTSGSVVTTADFDKDGDMDLFVGGRVIPGKYPYAPKSYLLINDNGKFTVKTKDIAPELENVGMVTDAQWNDIDNDNDLDLVVVGEWMGIEVFENEQGKLSKSYKQLSNTKGWWNTLQIVDIDYDGDMDIIAGNLGLNYKYQATKEKPFHIYTKDFDANGVEDIVLAKYYNDKQVPVRGKSCTAQQMPFLENKVKTYQDFANKDLGGILGEGIESALHYSANEFRSGIFINENNSKFTFNPFANEAQRSPINSILYDDFDNDGYQDLIMAGNNHQSEIETTRADAGIGSFLKGDGKGHFIYVPNVVTGFYANKDIRNMSMINTSEGKKILISNNNDIHELVTILKN